MKPLIFELPHKSLFAKCARDYVDFRISLFQSERIKAVAP
jgi:hypothetical protein